LLSIIEYNISQKGLATYVALCDFSTAFPSIHRGKLLSLLCQENIVGRMWKYLRERFYMVKVRVLHPRIPKVAVSTSCVECGDPECLRVVG